MDILILIIGIAVGVIIGWLLAKVLRPDMNSELDANNSVSLDRFNDLQNRLNSVLEEKTKVDDEVIRLSSELSRWTERHEQMELRLKEQKGEIGQLQDKFKNDFKVLAQEILEKTGNTFKEQNKEQIGTILAPIQREA